VPLFLLFYMHAARKEHKVHTRETINLREQLYEVVNNWILDCTAALMANELLFCLQIILCGTHFLGHLDLLPSSVHSNAAPAFIARNFYSCLRNETCREHLVSASSVHNAVFIGWMCRACLKFLFLLRGNWLFSENELYKIQHFNKNGTFSKCEEFVFAKVFNNLSQIT